MTTTTPQPERAHVVADGSDEPECIDDCPGCEADAADVMVTDRPPVRRGPRDGDRGGSCSLILLALTASTLAGALIGGWPL